VLATRRTFDEWPWYLHGVGKLVATVICYETKLLTFIEALVPDTGGRERTWWLRTNINDVGPLLMDVCGCAVRLSGWSETPGHRSKRRRESSLNEISCIKLLV